MADAEFAVPPFNLLLALVHLRGSGTTADFKAAFDIKDVRPEAKKPLLERELISVDTAVRPYVYELTDAGWLTARKLLSAPSPAKVSNQTARILWAIIGDFSAHMSRTGTELADLYPPRPEPSAADQILLTYRELAGDPADWVKLRTLRDRLDETDRATVDKALTDLHADRTIQLIPESNQKTLTDADRDAAIWLGGEYRHLIGIEVR
ncbi:hypothetical protein [Glycomyces harbinensis]|uniref:Uncharacterized protein n=1 Tax=Glycomyces harbinensis TaxID=58114 RepID=A0A1G6ZZD2_9ACTN|nr:hypothetical protein [Glycomyces harbinensis]SDE06996.1 hypothetical protein SAMN05216270_1124 [Glycomyces harbinensis]